MLPSYVLVQRHLCLHCFGTHRFIRSGSLFNQSNDTLTPLSPFRQMVAILDHRAIIALSPHVVPVLKIQTCLRSPCPCTLAIVVPTGIRGTRGRWNEGKAEISVRDQVMGALGLVGRFSTEARDRSTPQPGHRWMKLIRLLSAAVLLGAMLATDELAAVSGTRRGGHRMNDRRQAQRRLDPCHLSQWWTVVDGYFGVPDARSVQLRLVARRERAPFRGCDRRDPYRMRCRRCPGSVPNDGRLGLPVVTRHDVAVGAEPLPEVADRVGDEPGRGPGSGRGRPGEIEERDPSRRNSFRRPRRPAFSAGRRRAPRGSRSRPLR